MSESAVKVLNVSVAKAISKALAFLLSSEMSKSLPSGKELPMSSATISSEAWALEALTDSKHLDASSENQSERLCRK